MVHKKMVSVCLSVRHGPSVKLSDVCLPVFLSVYVFAFSDSLSVCLFVCLLSSLSGCLPVCLAYVASVSTRVRQERWDESKKKGMTGEGEGRGEKETLARKPRDFEKLRSPTNAALDWCCAGSVDYLALETSIKPGTFCLRASQIWSDLICGRRLQMLWSDIYLNHVCAKVYQI